MPNLFAELKRYDSEYREDLHSAIENLSEKANYAFMNEVMKNKDVEKIHNEILSDLEKINQCDNKISGKKLPTFETEGSASKESDIVKNEKTLLKDVTLKITISMEDM